VRDFALCIRPTRLFAQGTSLVRLRSASLVLQPADWLWLGCGFKLAFEAGKGL
jgi:hypothetical protein